MVDYYYAYEHEGASECEKVYINNLPYLIVGEGKQNYLLVQSEDYGAWKRAIKSGDRQRQERATLLEWSLNKKLWKR